jgi:hypothetical protein
MLTAHCSLDSFVVIFETHDVVFAEVVAELHFDEREWAIRAIAEPMIGFGRDVKVLALLQLKLAVAADDIGCARHDDPVLRAPRMSLQAEARTRLDLKPLDLVALGFLQNFIQTPGPLISFSHSSTTSRKIVSSSRFQVKRSLSLELETWNLKLETNIDDEHNEELRRDARKRRTARCEAIAVLLKWPLGRKVCVRRLKV